MQYSKLGLDVPRKKNSKKKVEKVEKKIDIMSIVLLIFLGIAILFFIIK